MFTDSVLSECSQGHPSDYLYQQVFDDDGPNKRYASRQEAAKYITMVTTAVKSYLDIVDMRTIKSLVKSSRENIDPLKENGILSHRSEKSVLQSPLTSKQNGYHDNRDVECDQGEVSYDYSVQNLRSDFKVVKKLQKYVQRFEGHIEKIAHPEDLPALKVQLVTLHCYAEKFSEAALPRTYSAFL